MCICAGILSSDPSFIPHHLSPVFQASTGDFSIVPYARVELFREKFSVHDVPAEVAKYCALYYYDPSWKMISRHLYRAGETVAAQLAKPHIHTVTGIVHCTCIMRASIQIFV